MRESWFELEAHGTSARREILAGGTTFLTMAYITFVNPSILADAGMDRGSVFVATCLAASLGTAIMGVAANYPIALAPGMGLNAFFTYSVVLGMGHRWQVALGVVFVSGVLFVILSLLPVREWIINSIPRTLKMAISAGIGLFLAIIALENAFIVVGHPSTLLTMGNLLEPKALLALGGFVGMVALDARGVPGAVILGILGTTALGLAFGISTWKGVAALPPDPSATLLQLDIVGALRLGLVPVIFTFLFVDVFDTAGTLVGVAHHAGLLDAEGRLPRLRSALMADSLATVIGALLGTSTTTSYIESAAGVKSGGRTGLTAVTVSVLFLVCLFFEPLAETVPPYATAPALLFVACLMARGITEIDWEDATEYAPAILTAIAMPLTFSIAHGIGLGFVSYAGIKIASGRARECPPAVLVIAVLFALELALL